MRPQSAKVYSQHSSRMPRQQQDNSFLTNQNDLSRNYPQSQQNFRPNYAPKIKQQSGHGKQSDRFRPQTAKQQPSAKNNNFMNNGDKQNNNFVPDYQRQIPKIIQVDKEKLYAETLQLKNQNNDLGKENLRLKTKLQATQTQLGKMERQFRDIEQTGIIKGSKNSRESSHLVNSLKNQIREMNQEVEDYKNELQRMKKELKYTRLQELETEKKEYENETIRLRQMLQGQLQQRMQIQIQKEDFEDMEEKLIQQTEDLQQLKQDNGELAQFLKNEQEISYQYQAEIQDLTNRLQTDRQQHKRILKQKEREIENLRLRQMQQYKPGGAPGSPQKGGRPQSGKQQLNMVSKQRENELLEELQNKDDRIIDLEQELQFLQQQMQNNNNNFQSTNNKDSTNNFQKTSNFNETGKHTQLTGTSQNKTQKMIQTVKLEEVKIIGEEIKFKLQALAIKWDDLVNQKQIFTPLEDNINLDQLKAILLEEPFYLQEDNSTLLSRFLIEGNENDMIAEDPYREASNKTILDRMKPIIGNYKVWDEKEAEQLFVSLGNKIEKCRSTLEMTLEMYCNKDDKQTMKKDNIAYSFKQIDVDLSKDEFEFLVSAIILDSIGINSLVYSKIFEVFKIDKEEDEYGEDSDQFYNSTLKQTNDLKFSKNSVEEKKIVDKYVQDQEEEDYYQEEFQDENIDNELKNKEQELLGDWQSSQNYDDQQGTNKNVRQSQEYENDYEEEIAEDDDNNYENDFENY